LYDEYYEDMARIEECHVHSIYQTSPELSQYMSKNWLVSHLPVTNLSLGYRLVTFPDSPETKT